MRVISVILCLLISTRVPAYAGSILWSSKHVITNLAKDEEWISEQLFSEPSVTAMEGIEATASDIEDSEADPEDSVTFIDATLMMEGIEGMGAIDPIIVVEETEATPLEKTMDPTTPDEMQEDGAVGNGVEHTAPEDGVDEIQPQTNP